MEERQPMIDEALQPEREQTQQSIVIRKDILVRKWVQDFTKTYTIVRKLGEGSYGEVFLVTHNQLKLSRALKIITKQVKETSNSHDELELLKKLDHPNILRIFEYFESADKWYIVTEYFPGSQLFDEIIKEGRLSERTAASMVCEIAKALNYIHQHKIAHRDIKAENILVRKEGEGYVLKVIDWGLGALVRNDEMNRRCGTPEYCAPQVLKGSYGIQCDLWSLGVLTYVMLSGRLPFKGKTVQQTLRRVKHGHPSFSHPVWKTITEQAKKFIVGLIQLDPSRRLKAEQCLSHSWIVTNLTKQSESTQIQLQQTLRRLQHYHTQSKFQIVVFNFILNFIEAPKQQARLKRQFQLLDTNGDGQVSYEELLIAYRRIYGAQADIIVSKIFSSIDMDHSGKISFSQFITFASQINHGFSTQQLRQAFKLFDSDNDGLIDCSQISELLSYEGSGSNSEFDEIVESIDINNDGKIDFDEFVEHINQAVARVKTKSGSTLKSSRKEDTQNTQK